MGSRIESEKSGPQQQQQESSVENSELLNGGAGTNEATPEPVVAPSPPRAPVSDDVDDEEIAGDDDGYDSAVEKMGSSSTSSVVEEPQAPMAPEVRMTFAQALQKRKENDEVETKGKDNGSQVDEDSSRRTSSAESEAEDDALSRQGSIRAMPVAKLSTESEEQEEEGDVDDEEEVEEDVEDDVEDEYEEANDQVLGEEDDSSSSAKEADALPRIIARETADDQFDITDAHTSSTVGEDVDEAASTPLPDQADDRVENLLSSEAIKTDNEVDDTRAEAPEEPDVETVLSQATSQLGEPKPIDSDVKKDVAPEVVPLANPDVGSVSKVSEGEATSKDTEPATVAESTREASSSLLEELRKLSVSRSLREKSAASEEAKFASEAESPDEPRQSVAKEEEESTTDSEPLASNPPVNELKELPDARLQTEASEAATNADETPVANDSRSGDQKVVNVGEGVTNESLDELKKLTYGFHMQGRSESEASELQAAAQPASTEEKESTDAPSIAITERLTPQAAEVQIMEQSGNAEGVNSATVKEELAKEDDLEGPAVVPNPAKLFAALNAVDDKLPALKSENGNVGEAEIVQQVKPRGFSAADFIGDSDGEDEDDDENNDEDDDEDDGEQDDTDLGTAKALAEFANSVRKSGSVSESGIKPSMGAAGPSLPSLPQRPAVRKSSAAAALDTAGRVTRRPAAPSSTQLATTGENANGDSAEGDETREKLHDLRVKFLRLSHRLGQSPQNVVVAQVLYRLGLAESLRGGGSPSGPRAFSFDRANALAEGQEAANNEEELDFTCTILVLGKTGVGKSATINSIFDDRKSATSAFKPSTHKVQEVVGTVYGIKVRVIDTPGLLPSVADQQHNERIMGQVKKHIKKASPDIVLYFDRLDMQSRDYGDLPLLRTITDLFGAAVWFNAIVVLTHSASAPPDGPNGVPLSYEMFVAQRSHVVQHTIRQAAGDMRLMNPVSLVENHPACRTNRNGQRVLPNGQIWKSQLLLLCFASKILAEANSVLKLQETATPGRPFGQRSRVPPLPFLLSSLLQSRAQLKLPDEQLGESDDEDDEEEEDDSDADDYDELPPFRPLSLEELEELDKEQRQDYMDEIADRERLFQKKQYREEMRRRKEMKKRAAQMSKEELSQPGDELDDEAGKAASVPVPMPDMALPPSFDSDNPTHRYRYLETANQWLVRPVLETHGWDHDAGYDGFNVEKMFIVKDKIPASISGQVTKDKKEAQVNFEAAASLKHGERKVTLTGFDIQTIGKDLAYTLRAETRFHNFKRNKTTAGLTCTVLNDTVAAGVKLEDRILIGKRVKMVVNGGVLTGKGDKAFGGSLEATLRGKEYPLSRTLSTLGLSVMDWHGDLAIGGNLQSQFMVGKTMVVGRANLNNRGSGQLSIRASSSEQLQMVLIGIVPILRSLINCRFGFGGPSSQQ